MAGQRYSSIEMLRRLVAFDTTSRGSNLALIEFVEAYLAGWGVASMRVSDATGAPKANLYARLGPDGDDGVLLSGHTDVVPVDDQDWTSPPFVLEQRGGRLYGRGTCDMKGFLAAALALVPDYLAGPRRAPLHLALSYDEELGCLGVPGLIEVLRGRGLRARAAIIGEPTGMDVVGAHKGILSFVTEITGKEAHSSAPHLGASAIFAAAEIVAFIGRLAEEQRSGAQDARFTPPYTTFSVGRIEGGTAVNIIPRLCRFTWECRPVPGADADALVGRIQAFARDAVLPKLRATHDAAEIRFTPRSRTPGLDPEPGSAAETLALGLCRRNATRAVSFATEAGLFQAAGFPTVVCGPGHIDQAHAADEYVELAQLQACEAFLRGVIAELG